MSRTSDLANYPPGRSFVQAVLDAVNRAEMTAVDMRYFAVREGQPAEYCRQRVRECDVYLAVTGFRYGSIVSGETISFTELEFQEATAAGKPRLVFLLDDPKNTAADLCDVDGGPVDRFRQRLRDAGLIVASFATADQLELEVFHALKEIASTLPGAVPRQLPAAAPHFAGRAAELADLDEVHDASTVVITAIDGMAGIGKTALAVHAAHRIADRYPDGQMFIDLHGYTPGLPPVGPAEALDELLRSLGVPGTHIPTGVEARAGLYRTRLADRRMLIVLDNAATEAQVRPLLPGTPGSRVLVTSRRRLSGLDRTHTVSLETLPTRDAVTLLAATVGEGRLAGQPAEVVTELVELCGRLPLAIRIAAARLRSHPAWQAGDLVARLRDRQQRLAELAAGQRSVTATLDLSYQDLDPDQRRAYRLMGSAPGTEFDGYATAALLDATLPRAGRVLDQLHAAHLLQEPAPGRYRFHDLVRAHAAHTAAGEQTASEVEAALERLLDYHRYAAAAATDAAYPYERDQRPPVPPAGTPSPALPDPAAGLAWLDTELSNLLATAGYATTHDRPDHLLPLSAVLHRHLRTRGRYHDAETLHQQALATAATMDNQAGRLTALNGLGDIHRMQGQYERATDHYQQALRIARTTGHPDGELTTLNGLGHIHLLQGRYEQAADHFQQALRIARTTANRPGEEDALNGLGNIHRMQGQYEQAADHYQQALRLARTSGNRSGELRALNGLGDIYRLRGRYEQAAEHYQRVLRLARVIGNRSGELRALNGLGIIYRMQSGYEQAGDYYRQALRIARTTGNRTAELNALTGLGHTHRMQGQYEQATDHHQQVLNLAQAGSDPNWEFEARQGLGRLSHATGDPETAITHHQQALALATGLNQPTDQARAHDGLAHAHHALGHHGQARHHWQHALHLLTTLGTDQADDEETTTAAIRAHLIALTENTDRGRTARSGTPPCRCRTQC